MMAQKSVEVVGLAMIGSIGDVTLRQLPDGPEDGVGLHVRRVG